MIETQETLIRTREIVGALSEDMVGIANRQVDLYVGDAKLATLTTSAAGIVQFNIMNHLTKALAEEDRAIRVASPDKEGKLAETSWTLSAFTMRMLMKSNPTGAAAPKAPSTKENTGTGP